MVDEGFRDFQWRQGISGHDGLEARVVQCAKTLLVAWPADPGVVDQDIYRLSRQLICQGIHHVEIEHIQLLDAQPVVLGAHYLQRIRRTRLAAGGNNVPAPGQVGSRKRQPDAAVGAGDEDGRG